MRRSSAALKRPIPAAARTGAFDFRLERCRTRAIAYRNLLTQQYTSTDLPEQASEAPRPRLHRLHQLRRRDVREVAARGGERGVSELRLDQVHGRPLECELGGVGVAQPVGV